MSRVNDYDAFAAAYDADNESNVYNAHYERPATLDLVGPVRGLRVLDAGCGSGALAQRLVAGGARVTALDASRRMLDIARRRLGPHVELVHADLAAPLPFPDASFDVVVASLVMHYLPSWEPPLAQFRRVLAPGGRDVISTHHPFMDFRLAGRGDYLGTYAFTEQWERGGQTVTMQFWHRPLSAMVEAFTGAGFVVERVAEPRPRPAAAAVSAAAFDKLSREPHFIFFALRSHPLP